MRDIYGNFPGSGLEPNSLRDLIREYTDLEWNEGTPRIYYSEILRHYREMNNRLGRDVGLPVALADYLINLRPSFAAPRLVDGKRHARLAELVERDPLTELYNRRHLKIALKREVGRARRHELPLSLLFLDIDHFKTINDRHGHPGGDRVIVGIARQLQRIVRREDTVVRYGGEEFVVLAPETNPVQARALAEKIRVEIAAGTWLPGGRRHDRAQGRPEVRPVTVSIGIATLPDHTVSGARLVRLADRAMYCAKSGGRNRVRMYCGPTEPSTASPEEE